MSKHKDLYEDLSEERKQHQLEGKMPEWYSTAGWQMFKEKYLYGTDSVRGQFERIARTAAKHLDGYGMKYKGQPVEEVAYDKFFNMLWNGWLSPATPVLANMGTTRGMPVSCSGGSIGDSIDSFYSNRHETACLTKNGFGTSAYMGSIRPRGSTISKGGKASGVVPVFKGFVQDMRDVAQGTQRRGAWAGYIELEHGDFDELADFVAAEPDDANVGWLVTDKFTERMEAGDGDAIRRYQKAMKLKMVTGKGYFVFIDKINRRRPKDYVDNNLYVKASNLCVAPETLVLTDTGHHPIEELEGHNVNIWNGHEWSNVEVVKTSEKSELLKVVTDSGQSLECTPYHKFYIKDRLNPYGKIVCVRAHELKPGDRLAKLATTVSEGEQELDQAYANGFYSGDGTLVSTNGKINGSRIYLYGEKRKLISQFPNRRQHVTQDNQDRDYFYVDGLKPKFFVPDNSYTVASRVNWLSGIFDSDGTVARLGESQCLQLGSNQFGFLKQIQLMLQTLGVQCKIRKMAAAGFKALPLNDGSGDSGQFYCQETYRLLISGTGIVSLLELGLNCHRLNISNHIPDRNAEHFVKITEVVYTGREDATYCFSEPKRAMGVFNGILTGQCTEITLAATEDLTFTCVLSSLNAAKWEEWKDTDTVFWATVFLDCVAEEFIERAEGEPGLQKAVEFTRKGRALGLGLCGLHTLFQQSMLPFESFQAQLLSQRISKHIWGQSEEASYWLADYLGSPEWCEGSGLRNTHRIAIAPTKSTALLMGGVSEGINPDPAMSYSQLTAAGEVDRVNPILLELMKQKGVNTRKNIKQVKDAMGSVQGVDWLTPEEKLVFKTGFEINQEIVVRLASARQQFIDQAQSLNLFFSADEDPAWISHVHKQAFLDPNILSLYYIYTQAGVQASKGESGCEACQ